MSTDPGGDGTDPDADPEMLQSKTDTQPDQAEGDDQTEGGTA